MNPPLLEAEWTALSGRFHDSCDEGRSRCRQRQEASRRDCIRGCGGAACRHLRAGRHGISWGWLLPAIGVEVISIVAFARMRRSIERDQHIGARRHGLAFSTITIAGTLLSGSTTLAEIVGASVLSLTTGALLVGGLATITKHPAPLVRIVGASMARLPRRWTHRDAGATPESSKHRVVEQLAAIQPRVRDWSTALAQSILCWTADLACFVLCLCAVGADGVVLSVAVVAYVAGLATIGLSVTPGGLGGVEAGMLIVLTHGGVANPLTLAGIVIYRLVAYRLVAYLLFGAVGWLAWLDVHRRQPSRIDGCAGCDDIPDALTVP